MAYAVRDWMKKIKRKDDKITKEQALEFMKGLVKIGRNVDNCYIEPYDDAIEKVIDYIKRSKEGEENDEDI